MRRNETRWAIIKLLEYVKEQEKDVESCKKHFGSDSIINFQYYQGKSLAYSDLKTRIQDLLERM